MATGGSDRVSLVLCKREESGRPKDAIAALCPTKRSLRQVKVSDRLHRESLARGFFAAFLADAGFLREIGLSLLRRA